MTVPEGSEYQGGTPDNNLSVTGRGSVYNERGNQNGLESQSSDRYQHGTALDGSNDVGRHGNTERERDYRTSNADGTRWQTKERMATGI